MFLITSTLFAFALGAILGSFLNVVIYRVPEGLSVVSPPSRCPHCGTGIKWYDNIPILSWAFLLDGKCRACQAPIPARYAIVEALTGALAATLWFDRVAPLLNLNPAWWALPAGALAASFTLYLVFICLLVAIAFIDLDHMIIPHGLSIPGILLGLASPWILGLIWAPELLFGYHWPPISPLVSFVGAAVGGLFVLAIIFIYYVLRGIPGMGGGDVTLMALVGAWLGWPALVFIFFGASVQGLIAAGVARAVGSSFIKDARDVFDEDEQAALDARQAAKRASAAPSTETSIETDEAPADAPLRGAPGQDAPDGAPLDLGDAAGEADAVISVNASSQEAVAGTDAGTDGEVDEQEGYGGMGAIPFGPFIVLSALEYLLLGKLLPESITMASFYFW